MKDDRAGSWGVETEAELVVIIFSFMSGLESSTGGVVLPFARGEAVVLLVVAVVVAVVVVEAATRAAAAAAAEAFALAFPLVGVGVFVVSVAFEAESGVSFAGAKLYFMERLFLREFGLV